MSFLNTKNLLRAKLFYLIAFAYLFSIAFMHVNLRKEKQTSYIKSISANGYHYIVPKGKALEFGDSDAYNKLAYSLIEKGDFYNPINQKSLTHEDQNQPFNKKIFRCDSRI